MGCYPFWLFPPLPSGTVFFAHLAISEAKIRGVGVTTAIEVFDQIVDPLLSTEHKEKKEVDVFVDAVRAVAVVIVCNKRFYSSKEVLLRHAVTHMNLDEQARGEDSFALRLGDIDLLLQQLLTLSSERQSAVLQVLCLAVILDGSVSSAEAALINKVIDVVDDSVATSEGKVVDRLRRVAQTFRNLDDIWQSDLQDCLRTDCTDGFKLGGGYYCRETCRFITRMVTC